MGVVRGRGFCTECKKWGGPLQVIEIARLPYRAEELCPPCLERKGGKDYIEALRGIEEESNE